MREGLRMCLWFLNLAKVKLSSYQSNTSRRTLNEPNLIFSFQQYNGVYNTEYTSVGRITTRGKKMVADSR